MEFSANVHSLKKEKRREDSNRGKSCLPRLVKSFVFYLDSNGQLRNILFFKLLIISKLQTTVLTWPTFPWLFMF